MTHEEADVIMVFHMIKEAVTGHSPIKVVSDETDDYPFLPIIFIHVQTICPLELSWSWSHVPETVLSLISMFAAYAPTDCNRVSCFSGIGKITILKKMDAITEVLKLGELSTSMVEVTASCLKYAATLYGEEFEGSINTMCADTFTKKMVARDICHHEQSAAYNGCHSAPIVNVLITVQYCGKLPVCYHLQL